MRGACYGVRDCYCLSEAYGGSKGKGLLHPLATDDNCPSTNSPSEAEARGARTVCTTADKYTAEQGCVRVTYRETLQTVPEAI